MIAKRFVLLITLIVVGLAQPSGLTTVVRLRP